MTDNEELLLLDVHELRDRIVLLEKEADWLAKKLAYICSYSSASFCAENCPVGSAHEQYDEDCEVRIWREAALAKALVDEGLSSVTKSWKKATKKMEAKK